LEECKYKNRNSFRRPAGPYFSGFPAFNRQAYHCSGKTFIPRDRFSIAMTSHFDSLTSASDQPKDAGTSGWLKLGIIAGASALAGGLAAAWWYRKTLSKLHQVENSSQNVEFRNLEDDSPDER
jgi:hypothetical protein